MVVRAGLILAVLASACGGGSATATAPSTSSTTPPAQVLGTSTMQPRDDLAVLQAYESMWNAVRRALNPPNPDLPELAATHTGPALDAVRSQARDVLAKGAVMRGDVELHPTVVSRTDSEAVIVDCIVDHGHLIDPANGARLDTDQPDVVYNHARTTMVKLDGVWKRRASEQLPDRCTPPISAP